MVLTLHQTACLTFVETLWFVYFCMTPWPYVFVCYSSKCHVTFTDDRDVFHFQRTEAQKRHQHVCAIHCSVSIRIDQFLSCV